MEGLEPQSSRRNKGEVYKSPRSWWSFMILQGWQVLPKGTQTLLHPTCAFRAPTTLQPVQSYSFIHVGCMGLKESKDFKQCSMVCPCLFYSGWQINPPYFPELNKNEDKQKLWTAVPQSGMVFPAGPQQGRCHAQVPGSLVCWRRMWYWHVHPF